MGLFHDTVDYFFADLVRMSQQSLPWRLNSMPNSPGPDVEGIHGNVKTWCPCPDDSVLAVLRAVNYSELQKQKKHHLYSVLLPAG